MSYEGEPKYPQFGGSGSGSNQVGFPGGRPSFPSAPSRPSTPAYPTPGYPSSSPGYPSGRPQQPFPTPNQPIPKPGGFPGNQIGSPSKPGIGQQYGPNGGYRY